MTLARRRFPRTSAGCRSSRTPRCRPGRCASCWPPTTPAPVRASTAPTRPCPPPTRRPPVDRRVDRGAASAVTDPHRRLRRPGVRQLIVTDRQFGGARPAAGVATRPGRGSPTTTTPPASASSCPTVTLANWAAKTANLLARRAGRRAAAAGSRCCCPRTGRPPRCCSGSGGSAPKSCSTATADIALCTADRLAEADAAVGVGEIAVLSLDPFGKPVPDLPVGVTDYATSVRVHGDQIVARTPPRCRAGRPVGHRCARRRPSFRCRTGFHRRRSGALDRALGHRRRSDRQPAGGLRGGRFAGAGGQPRSGGERPPPADREDHPRTGLIGKLPCREHSDTAPRALAGRIRGRRRGRSTSA